MDDIKIKYIKLRNELYAISTELTNIKKTNEDIKNMIYNEIDFDGSIPYRETIDKLRENNEIVYNDINNNLLPKINKKIIEYQ